MKYRTTTILAPEDQTNGAGTKTIDIDVIDPISRIEIKFRAQNGAAGNSDHPAANITKIELVDGANVLFSLTGKEAQAVNFYNRGIMPAGGIDTINDHWNTAYFSIDFGRYLWDTDLALVPEKFGNLQLKITYDEDVCQTSADANYLSVYAFCFDEKTVSPRGFLMTKELREYTGAAGAYESTDVPTDYIIKQIYVFGRYATNTFCTQIDEIRLSEEHLKRIVVDLSSAEFLYWTLERYGRTVEHAYLMGVTSATYFYAAPSDSGYALMSGYGADAYNCAYTHDGGKFGYNTNSATVNGKAIISGVFPHGACPILFYNDKNIDDWYDVRAKKNIELRIKAGASYSTSGNIQIVTEQLRTY